MYILSIYIFIAVDYFILQENYKFVLYKTGFDQSVVDSVKLYCESLGVEITIVDDLSTIKCTDCVLIINKYDSSSISYTGPIIFITQPSLSSPSFDYYYLSLTRNNNKNQYEVIMYLFVYIFINRDDFLNEWKKELLDEGGNLLSNKYFTPIQLFNSTVINFINKHIIYDKYILKSSAAGGSIEVASHIDFYNPVKVHINENDKNINSDFYIGCVCNSAYDKEEYLPYVVTIKYFNYNYVKEKGVAELNLLFKKYDKIDELDSLFQSNKIGSFIIFDEYSKIIEIAYSI